MNERGWIRLYRKTVRNPLWTHLPAEWLKVWLGVLFRANLSDSTYFDGHNEVHMKPGSLITSAEKLALYCNVSIKQVRGTLDYLERAGMVTRFRASKYSVLTICNWGTYQSGQTSDGSQNGSQDGEETAGMRAMKGQRKGNERATDKEVRSKNPPSREGISPETEALVGATADRLLQRHPAMRRCSPKEARDLLRKICFRLPADQRIAKLHSIDENHAAHCATDQWTKQGGEFAKSLNNWLAPSMGKFDVRPEANPQPAQYPKFEKQSWEDIGQ